MIDAKPWPRTTDRHIRATEPTAETIVEEPLSFLAGDGSRLHGTLFICRHDGNPGDVALFNTGCGLTWHRYRHFLRFVASRSIPIVAYDYRGVGISAPIHRRGFVAGIEDWAEYDQAGALSYTVARFPTARITAISHSIGCMVAVSAPNAALLKQLVLIAPHTGYWGDYRMPWKIPMTLAWHAIMPLLVHAIGYFPGRLLHLGDDFPKRVALQWAARLSPQISLSKHGDYRARQVTERMRLLTKRAMILAIDDDAFATDRAVRRFLSIASGIRGIRNELPTAGRSVGHFGFFSRQNAADWSLVTNFVQQR